MTVAILAAPDPQFRRTRPMHAHLDQYRPAPPERVADARRLFPYREMSAAEYAARHGGGWVCFSFDDFVYEDPALNEWIHTLGDILFTPGALQAVRRRYFSEAEIAELEQKARETWS
jgi:hypothetical protein